ENGNSVVVAARHWPAYTLSGESDAPTLLLRDTVIADRRTYWLNLPYTQAASRPRDGSLHDPALRAPHRDKIAPHIDVGRRRNTFSRSRMLQFLKREVHARFVSSIDLIAKVLLGVIPGLLSRPVLARRQLSGIRRAPAPLDALIGIK